MLRLEQTEQTGLVCRPALGVGEEGVRETLVVGKASSDLIWHDDSWYLTRYLKGAKPEVGQELLPRHHPRSDTAPLGKGEQCCYSRGCVDVKCAAVV